MMKNIFYIFFYIVLINKILWAVAICKMHKILSAQKRYMEYNQSFWWVIMKVYSCLCDYAIKKIAYWLIG